MYDHKTQNRVAQLSVFMKNNNIDSMSMDMENSRWINSILPRQKRWRGMQPRSLSVPSIAARLQKPGTAQK